MGAGSRAGRMFGRYRIVELIGRGGMGEVYRAEDTVKGRQVALKILAEEYSHDDRFRLRFQRESRSTAILQEPHVIPIHDWGEIDGNLYIDMRLVAGRTLDELLADGPLAPARAAHIIGEVACALDAAHAAGLVHRDVKPQNIIVTASDFPYLVDFGIAQAAGDSTLTMTGTNIGTLDYMAPERFTGGEVTPAVDVYALACVLHQTLTGAVPFQVSDIDHAVGAHLTTPPPRPSVANPHVPFAFDAVVARGMAKKPAHRYPSASALGHAAKQALGSASAVDLEEHAPSTVYGDVAPAPRPAPRPQPPPVPAPLTERRTPGGGRSWLVPGIVLTAVLLAAGAVLFGVFARGGDGPRTPETSLVKAPGGAGAPSTDDPPAPSPTEIPLDRGAPPPLVTGPDTSAARETCDGGFRVPGPGVGRQSRRGSPDTSCFFARSVLDSYWGRYADASREQRTVYAPGTVDCRTVASGNLCRGADFVMTCVGRPGDAYITCEGGRGARVFIF